MQSLSRYAVYIIPLVVGCSDLEPSKSKPKEVDAVMSEHAVLVYLKLSDDDYGTLDERDEIHELSDRLEQAINDAGVGEFDGDEFGGGKCTLFMYGPDADALFLAIEPILRDSLLAKGGHVIMRYGEASDPNAKEVRESL